MHYLYFVVFDKKEAKDSDEARGLAESTLVEQNFCGGEGYFCESKADWFVIGGRWSGLLSWIQLEIDPSNQEKLRKAWKKANIKEVFPYDRNTFSSEGHGDDAMIVGQKLLEALRKKYSDIEIYDADNNYEISLGGLEDKDLLNRWIVVIDYHN